MGGIKVSITNSMIEIKNKIKKDRKGRIIKKNNVIVRKNIYFHFYFSDIFSCKKKGKRLW